MSKQHHRRKENQLDPHYPTHQLPNIPSQQHMILSKISWVSPHNFNDTNQYHHTLTHSFTIHTTTVCNNSHHTSINFDGPTIISHNTKILSDLHITTADFVHCAIEKNHSRCSRRSTQKHSYHQFYFLKLHLC